MVHLVIVLVSKPIWYTLAMSFLGGLFLVKKRF